MFKPQSQKRSKTDRLSETRGLPPGKLYIVNIQQIKRTQTKRSKIIRLKLII